MSITFKKKQVSEFGRGRVVTEPMVHIAENGQVSFNSLAQKVLEGLDMALYGSDDENPKRKETVLQIRGIKTPAKYPVKVAGVDFLEKELIHLKRGKDGKSNVFFALAADLKLAGYDYAKSGSQNFKCDVDEKNHTVTWSVPVGALTPRPKAERKPRKAKSETAATAPNGAVAASVSKDAAVDDLLA